MSGNYTAKTRFPLRQPANVIWSNLWDNAVTLGTPSNSGTGATSFYKSTVTGDDSRGNASTDVAALFGTTGPYEIQYIVDKLDQDDGRPLSDTFTLSLAPTTAPGGKGNEIIITQKRRRAAVNSGSWPQLQVITNFASSTRRSICISQSFKLPSNLAAIFDSYAPGTGTRWMEFFACKNGNYGDPSGSTDSRFTIQAVRMRTRGGVDETGMRYMFQFDSGSGGGTNFWGTSLYSPEGSLVPGVWHKYTMYIEQPASISDLTTGKFQCIIQNLVTGEIVASVNKLGGQFYGPLGRKLTRISNALCYTGGFPSPAADIEIRFSDFEISENARYPLTTL